MREAPQIQADQAVGNSAAANRKNHAFERHVSNHPDDYYACIFSNDKHFPFVTPPLRHSELNSHAGVQSHMTNKFTQSLLILAVGGLMVAGSAAAQTQNNTSGAGPGQVDPGHPRVNQVNRRETRQQNRIGNGVKSGQLTPGETRRLERGEQRLQNNEKKDMAKDNGHLTKQDQRQLNREENRMSKRIYADKHNARTAK